MPDDPIRRLMPRLAPRIPVKSDFPYMTTSERYAFKEMREAGTITFFRARLCLAKCGAEVPESKLYCSKECYDGCREQGEQNASTAGEDEDAHVDGDAK